MKKLYLLLSLMTLCYLTTSAQVHWNDLKLYIPEFRIEPQELAQIADATKAGESYVNNRLAVGQRYFVRYAKQQFDGTFMIGTRNSRYQVLYECCDKGQACCQQPTGLDINAFVSISTSYNSASREISFFAEIINFKFEHLAGPAEQTITIDGIKNNNLINHTMQELAKELFRDAPKPKAKSHPTPRQITPYWRKFGEYVVTKRELEQAESRSKACDLVNRAFALYETIRDMPGQELTQEEIQHRRQIFYEDPNELRFIKHLTELVHTCDPSHWKRDEGRANNFNQRVRNFNDQVHQLNAEGLQLPQSPHHDLYLNHLEEVIDKGIELGDELARIEQQRGTSSTDIEKKLRQFQSTLRVIITNAISLRDQYFNEDIISQIQKSRYDQVINDCYTRLQQFSRRHSMP